MHFGYIDPGTGSLVLQAIIGVVLGAIVFLRTHIISFFGKFRSHSSDEPLVDDDK